MADLWWKKGIQFECQGSGRCCVSRGEYGFVFLTLTDRRNLAAKLGMRVSAFTRKYCSRLNGTFHLKETPNQPECIFLKKNRCSVYTARPTQCRTWPFWSEVLPAKTWSREVASYCPGVGKGRVWSAEVVQNTSEVQEESNRELDKEALKFRRERAGHRRR